jgi:hypothetical protein
MKTKKYGFNESGKNTKRKKIKISVICGLNKTRNAI